MCLISPYIKVGRVLFLLVARCVAQVLVFPGHQTDLLFHRSSTLLHIVPCHLIWKQQPLFKLKPTLTTKKRMHSSRMRTARSSSHGGGLPQRMLGYTPRVWVWRPLPWVWAWKPTRHAGLPPTPENCCKACWDTTCNACWDTNPSLVNRILDTRF